MVQKFEYKRATMEDIDELVRTRIIVLRAANKLSDDEDMSVVEEESKAYYRRALETGEHIAYLVYDNGAFVLFYVRFQTQAFQALYHMEKTAQALRLFCLWLVRL